MTNPNLTNMAPELLETLEELFEDYLHGSEISGIPEYILEEDALVKKCRTVIAKAKGEQL